MSYFPSTSESRFTICSGGVPEGTINHTTRGALSLPTISSNSAEEHLRDAPVERFIVTDSVLLPEGLGLSLEVVSLAPLLASATIACTTIVRSMSS